VSEQGRLVLASQSPRRREILAGLGLHFEVCPADIDETPAAGEQPRVYARRMALEKAGEVARDAFTSTATGTTVVGADTIVVCEGVLMGKPRDDAQALTMLSRLAGT